MANDNRAFRLSDPYPRDAASGGQSPDPLAELARLIGQSDPFADLGRRPEQDARSQSEPDWNPGEMGAQAPGPDHQADPYAGGRGEAYPQHDADPYRQDAYAQPIPGYDDPQAAGPEGYDQDQDAYAYAGQGYYDDVDPSAAPEFYEETAWRRRRGGMIAVLGVLGLAVVGTAGAYSYRAMFGPSGEGPQAPVIKAAETPNKVQVASTESGKLIQDRLPDGNQGETRVLPREEAPVDVRSAAAGGGPKITYPPLAPPNTRPVVAPQLPQVNAAVVPGASGGLSTEPKKIRTIPIRPEHDAAARNAAPPDAAAPRSAALAPAPTRTASTPAPAPTPAPGPVASASTDSPFPPTTRAAASRQQAEERPSSNAPLSLSATSGSNGASAHRGRSRVASAATDAVPPGSYVQVTSQRSEADAQASFRALQNKYPNVLGGQQVVIRRADLGSRGIYYRAMVGPFDPAQATQLCSSLKAAGGQCVIQRN